jgi:glucokinase
MQLVADIGGTHARFRLGPREATLPSGAHRSAEDAIETFLAGAAPPAVFVLAVAGPVQGGRCVGTNLPWSLDERALGERFGARVKLLNDFEAVAEGVERVASDELRPLRGGLREDGGTIAIVGAGTGLGEALVVRDGAQRIVVPSEGGHSDFGPWDERSDAVLRHLRAKYGRVSAERVASGLGLADLYPIVLAEGWAPGHEETLAAAADPARAIGEAVHADAAARLAVELFARALGAEAGNLALTSMPRGGVRIAGGMLPKLLDRAAEIVAPAFLAGYLDKGRMRPVVERFAVDVVLAGDVGLRGAAVVAERMASAARG